MLKLKPSMRIKRRYILLQAKNKESVEKAVLDYVGILGWAKAAPTFVKHPGEKIVLAISRESINEVRAAFEICKENIKVIRVSGTIKGLANNSNV
ncbi:MAG: Rpp14/Pop5 family protein [Nanoarchaeota archaeon]